MPPHDFGAVAVIDGTTVKITPLRTANVPPPMSMFEIGASHVVIDVAFSQDNSKMAVLHHGGVDLFDWQTRNGRSIIPRLSAKYEFSSGGVVDSALQIGFAINSEAGAPYFKDGLKICRLSPARDADKLMVEDVISLEEEILFPQANSIGSASPQISSGDMCIQNKSGKLFRLPAQGKALESLATGFPLQLPLVEVVETDDEIVAFGMSRSGHLYANSRLLVKNCTSFLVTCDHLIFTTSNHFLKFIHLNRPEGMSLKTTTGLTIGASS